MLRVEDSAIAVTFRDDLLRPLEIRLVARETRDEFGARHAALVDDRMQDLTLDLTHFVDLRAQRVAQALDSAGREADRHQFGLNGFLRLQIRLRLVAFLLVRATHLVEPLADQRELLQRRALERFELSGVGIGLRGAFVLFLVFVAFFLDFLFFLALDRFRFLLGEAVGIGGVRVDQPVDEFVHARLFVLHALGHRENVGDSRRAGGDRHDHVLQAVFDPLRDLDFAFAREQFDRTHFAHVHAHRVGRAAEFGIDGGQRDFGFFLDFVVGRSGGRVVVQQQRFGIGRLLVHGHAHVVERADDPFDRFGFGEVVGKVIVDFRVGQEAALLAELDQRAQFRAALLEFLDGAGRGRRERVLQQRFFLRSPIACLDLFHLGRGGGGGGRLCAFALRRHRRVLRSAFSSWSSPYRL